VLWFRMHSEVRSDPKIQTMPGDLVKSWLNFLCFACENQGYLPRAEEMAWELRTTPGKIERSIVLLLDRGLIEDRQEGLYMHSWDFRQFHSDSSTERVREHRKKQRETFPEHPGNVPPDGESVPSAVSGNVSGTLGNGECNGNETALQSTDNRKQKTEGKISPFETELNQIASRMYERHPELRRCSERIIKSKLRAIAKKSPSAERINRIRAIDISHAAWCLYWALDDGRFAKGLENWLAPTMGRFDEPAPGVKSNGLGRPSPGLIL
jgi:hypothetical protein